jgi:hypothetical protein
VAELPEEPAAEEPAYGEGEEFEQVVLCQTAGQLGTDLVRNALTAAGIPCRVLYAGILPELGCPTPAAGAPVNIYVNARDLAAARKVYRGSG